jgi:2-keto-4-pentenoate hydratase/2-oxohepta-3-ene-1,7-dioic acid hydratase in catechol pathway
MKICRFYDNKSDKRFGIVENKIIIEIEGTPFDSFTIKDKKHNLDEVKLLAPCVPSKIVAIGLNYKDHAAEMNKKIPDDPMLFLKPSSSVIAHEDNIIYPSHMSSRVDFEGELAVVISKEAKHIKPSSALDYVLGYTCINDVTARDLQAKDGQFTRAKGFDTFAPLGPWIETRLSPFDLEIKTFLNGDLKQHSNTSNLIFAVPKLISFISNVMTLYPGDIISTGTPSGIAPMKPGDRVEVEIQGIGILKNYIVTQD